MTEIAREIAALEIFRLLTSVKVELVSVLYKLKIAVINKMSK